jgi:hypothetical protein
MVRLVQTVHLSSVALSPNGPNRAPPDPHHLGVPRVRLKQFMNLWYVRRKSSNFLAPTLTLFQTDRNKIPHDPHNLGVPLGASNTISEPTVRSTQIVHQSCIKSSTISKWTVPSFHWSLVT